MLTKRDREILRFVDKFGMVTTAQIKEYCFPNVTLARCQQRMHELVDQGHLNRERCNVNCDYVYYSFKQPMQHLEHTNTRVNFFLKMWKAFPLYDFIPEYQFGKLRADAFTTFQYYGLIYAAFVEIQLTGYFNQEKYEKLYSSGTWRDKWQGFPLVILLTNGPVTVQPSKLKYIVLDSAHPDMRQLKAELPGRLAPSHSAGQRPTGYDGR